MINSFWENALKSAIESHLLYMQDMCDTGKATDLIAELGEVGFAKAFCTLKINTPRAIGKTTFINTYALEEDLVIALDQRWTKEFENAGRKAWNIGSRDVKTMPVEYWRIIWFDEPGCAKNKVDLDAIYKRAITTDETELYFNIPLFVMLGESI